MLKNYKFYLNNYQMQSIGCKAFYLKQMIKLEIPIPEFEIIDTSGNNLISKINTCAEKFNNKLLAVRSSSTNEDNRHKASAGKYFTKLYVQATSDAIKQAIQECYQKAHNEKIAIIIQEMIDCDSSGVLFTRGIKLSNLNYYIVESTWGQGSTLVQGLITPDYFEINRNTKSIIKQRIASKNTQCRQSGLCMVDKTKVKSSSISFNQLKKLIAIGEKIENHFGCPQDIEWGIKHNQIYIFQTRAITNLPNNSWFEPKVLNQMHVLDDSNIRENFSKATSILTYSFFKEMYYQSYKILLSALGVSNKIIHRVEPELRNLIIYLNGYIQYNLTNWHKILALFPFIKDKHSFLEQMMGVKYEMNSLYLQELGYLKSHVDFKSMFKLMHYIFTAKKQVKLFEKKFNKMRQSFESIKVTHLSLKALIQQIESQISSAKTLWKIPMINDCYVMIACGLFKKEAEKEGINSLNYLSQVDLSSINGLNQLNKIKEYTSSNWWKEEQTCIIKILNKLVRKKTLSEEELILYETHPEVFNKIYNYIHKYGPRCANEQMLELDTPYENPEMILTIINNFIPREKKPNTLPKLTRKLNFLFHHAKISIQLREKLRIYRAQLTMLNRRVFNAMGEYLWKLGVIDLPKDVFNLTLTELKDYSRGNIGSIIEIINQRKKKQKTIPPSRTIVRGPISLSVEYNLMEEPSLNTSNLDSTFAQGTAASPGNLTGKAIRINSIEDFIKINITKKNFSQDDNLILITQHLDPSWIPLFGKISGALVEYGGTLTHTAIAARESGIPMVVNVDPSFVASITDEQIIKLNGNTGLVQIISN